MSNNPTANQMDALLTFLEEHRELARGHLRNAEGRNISRNLWNRLTDELNALGGCTKNVKQWQRVWADKKYLAKKAAVAARRSASATGGEPSIAGQLSAQELRIISVMGEGYDETDARVSAFPQFQEILHEVEVTRAPGSPSSSPERNEQQQRRESSLYSSSSISSHRRRRQRRGNATGARESVHRRLFEIEERRLATEIQHTEQLSAIREAIQELCRVIQTGFQDIATELRARRRGR